MPLNPDEYGNGRTVKSPDGDEYDITGGVTDNTGQGFLVAVHPDAPGVGVLLSTATVRDEYEARDPEEVAQERQDATDATDSENPDSKEK